MSIDPLDPRRNAIRDDLADIRLQGKVERPRYAEPVRRVVAVPSARCHTAPALGAFDTEFLYGEAVDVFDVLGGKASASHADENGHIAPGDWSWVQSAVDGYVGYVRTDFLGDPDGEATHEVLVPRGVVYEDLTIKQGFLGHLPLGARVSVSEFVHQGEHFARLGQHKRTIEPRGERGPWDRPTANAYLLTQHLSPLGGVPDDWVAIAELFIGTPYVWGGKTWEGIDCSGLVQLALQGTGRQAPRDSDMQSYELGEALPADTKLQRGDLVFWRGHVGIMVDDEQCLHANGHHMLTAVEPLSQTIERLGKMGLEVTVRRRIT
ncbi:MAG: NlpC/P60 family protein [Pseudomonadota bacterium]